MRKVFLGSLVLLVSAVGWTARAQADQDVPWPWAKVASPSSVTEIYEVTDVTIHPFTIENDDRVVVIAEGVTTTGGWTNPTLSPWVYIAPPEGGIYDFTFLARPPAPDLMVTEALTPIEAELILRDPPDDFRGVRVHAGDTSVEAVLE